MLLSILGNVEAFMRDDGTTEVVNKLGYSPGHGHRSVKHNALRVTFLISLGP